MKFKYVVGLGVAAATFATVATPLAVTSVKAEATDRKSVVQGKRVSRGGGRSIQKK